MTRGKLALALLAAVAVAERVHAELDWRAVIRSWTEVADDARHEAALLRGANGRAMDEVERLQRAGAQDAQVRAHLQASQDRQRATWRAEAQRWRETEEALTERLAKALADGRDVVRQRDDAEDNAGVMRAAMADMEQQRDDARRELAVARVQAWPPLGDPVQVTVVDP